MKMTKLAKQMIMKGAWNLAKRGANRFGGKSSDYLAESLKMVWKIYRRQRNRFNTDIAGIAPWFIKKEYGPMMVSTVNVDSELKVKKETEKAVLIDCTIYAQNHKNVLDRRSFWAPKSVIF